MHVKTRKKRASGAFLPASRYVVQSAAGVLFLVMGVAGLTGEPIAYGDIAQSFYRFFTGYYKPLLVVFALLEVLIGTALTASAFIPAGRPLEQAALSAAAAVLLFIIILQFFVAPAFGSALFDWTEWAWMLALHLIVFSSLYQLWLKR